VAAAVHSAAVHETDIDQIQETPVGDRPTSLRHLDRSCSDRGRRHAETAAGDRHGTALVDAPGLDEVPKSPVERPFRLRLGLRPGLFGRASAREAMHPDVEDLRCRGAEAGVEDEVEVGAGDSAARRKIIHADQRQTRLVARAEAAGREPVLYYRRAKAAIVGPAGCVSGLLATDPIGLGEYLYRQIARFRRIRVLEEEGNQVRILVGQKSDRPKRRLSEIAET